MLDCRQLSVTFGHDEDSCWLMFPLYEYYYFRKVKARLESLLQHCITCSMYIIKMQSFNSLSDLWRVFQHCEFYGVFCFDQHCSQATHVSSVAMMLLLERCWQRTRQDFCCGVFGGAVVLVFFFFFFRAAMSLWPTFAVQHNESAENSLYQMS